MIGSPHPPRAPIRMSSTVTDQPATTSTSGNWESSRREKLERITELGRDPWGSRFDDHAAIADIRARASEIFFNTQDGRQLTLIDPAAAGADFDFRKWLADQGPGEMTGPQVRAAGRIVLHRDKGKLQFIDIRDMTGQIQLFVGQQQVGDDWALAQCLDLGDIIGVDGELRRTKTGELSIFAHRLTILTKSLAAPPEKHHGLTDPELRQRQRYLDLTYGEGVMPRFLNRTKIIRVDSRDARPARVCRSRRADAALDRRRRGGPAVQNASQRARHRPLPADRARTAPQAADGRRHRAGVRAGPRVSQ